MLVRDALSWAGITLFGPVTDHPKGAPFGDPAAEIVCSQNEAVGRSIIERNFPRRVVVVVIAMNRKFVPGSIDQRTIELPGALPGALNGHDLHSGVNAPGVTGSKSLPKFTHSSEESHGKTLLAIPCTIEIKPPRGK